MKISYNRAIDRFVISEQGKIICTTPTLGDAQRLAGCEPEPDYFPIERSDFTDTSDFQIWQDLLSAGEGAA